MNVSDRLVPKKAPLTTYISKKKYLYLMIVPAIIYLAIFHYWPMYGILIAFKNFSPTKGILNSSWVGFKYFEWLFSSRDFLILIRNTVIISSLKIIFAFPVPLIIALFLNEMISRKAVKIYQTVIYLPHFVSWAIMAGIIYQFAGVDGGIINEIIKYLGGKPIMFLSDSKYFRSVLVFTDIWKESGWNSIIYIAALHGINQELYEAAYVDGANRIKQTWYITLPCIMPTISIMLILAVGQIMNAGFMQILVLYNASVLDVGDILDTYVYRVGLQGGQYSFATAAGLFKSVVAMVMLLGANKIVSRMGGEGLY